MDIYHKAFNEKGGVLWEDSTLYLYIILIVAAAFIGYIADHAKVNISHFFTFVLSFLLLFILGLRSRDVGIDTEVYQDSFLYALTPNAFSDRTDEPGFHFLLQVLRTFFSSPELAILIFSAATIFFVMNTVWRYKSHISFFIAFSFYVGIFYFQALNLLRIYLAASFILWNYNYLIEKKYKKFALIVLLTSLLHYSSLIMLMPLGFLWLYQKKPKMALFLIACAFVVAVKIADHFADYMFLVRYASYGENNEASSKIGLMLYFDYLPCFYLVYYIYKNKIKGQWSDILVSLTATGFFLRFIAYNITIAGRLGTHLMGLFVLVLPYFTYHIKQNHRRQYIPFVSFLLIYLVVRIHFYFIGYLATDGIMPYNFFWND